MSRIVKLFVVLSAIALFTFLPIFSSGQGKGEGNGNEEAKRIQKGFEIAPVPLNLKGKDHNLVGLGSYIVNAQAACNDCHTCPSYAPGHNPF